MSASVKEEVFFGEKLGGNRFEMYVFSVKTIDKLCTG